MGTSYIFITTAAEDEQKLNTNTEQASKSTTAAIKHSANIPNPTYSDTTSTTTTITTTKTTNLVAGTIYIMADGNFYCNKIIKMQLDVEVNPPALYNNFHHSH